METAERQPAPPDPNALAEAGLTPFEITIMMRAFERRNAPADFPWAEIFMSSVEEE